MQIKSTVQEIIHVKWTKSCKTWSYLTRHHIWTHHHQLDTVHAATLCLVNLLEELRQYPSKHIVAVLPDELMNSVAAKSLESTIVVYHSIYNLTAAVAYVPFAADLDANSDESKISNNTNDDINFVMNTLTNKCV